MMSVWQCAASVAMVLGGALPYVPQYRAMRRSGGARNFSLHVCSLVLAANVLRVLFWMWKRFELPLLLQSVVMIVVMLALLHASTAEPGGRPLGTRTRRLAALRLEDFWRWDSFWDFATCVGALSACAAACSVWLCRGSPGAVEVLGTTALLCEALLGAPQLRRVLRSRSAAGMSVAMVLLWLVGDVFKTVYFVVNAAPLQFWACGVTQVCVDIAILVLAAHYGCHPVGGGRGAVPPAGVELRVELGEEPQHKAE